MWFWLLLIIGIVFTLTIYFGRVPLNTRYVYLIILILGILWSINVYKLDYHNLGLRLPTEESVMVYGLITFLGVLLLRLQSKTIKNRRKLETPNKLIENNKFYVLFSAPLQEFMVRSYPLAMFRYFEWNSFWGYVAFSTTVFTFMHVFLKDRQLLIFTIVMGAVWSGAFYFFPDFLLLSVSHAVLGIWLGRNLYIKK